MFIHCSNKLEISFCQYCTYVKGKCRDTSDQIQQAVLLGVLKDTNFALVSTAPARLHCYLLEKAQFGLLRPVLTQGYQVFLGFFFLFFIFTADLSKTLSSAMTIQKKKWNHWVWESPVHHSLLCGHSVCQGAVGIQAKRSTQHLNHCLSYVSCCVFIFSVFHTCLVTRQSQWEVDLRP